MMWRRGSASLAAVATLLSCDAFGNTGSKGVVTGGVVRCSGLYDPNAPHYQGGTVTVLKGQITWKSNEQGNLTDVFPTRRAAQQSVETDGTYWFLLAPGQYVLSAGVGHVSVTVQPGDDLGVDVPNMCI
jgi:hypothetical protein